MGQIVSNTNQTCRAASPWPSAATIVEVLTSQVTLDDAEIALIRARRDFLVARAQLEALLGREL